MAATVSITAPVGRQINSAVRPTLIPVTIAANSVSYTTTGGGLAFDLFAFLSQASTPQVQINPKDILGFLSNTVTSPTKYMPFDFALGTTTSTTVPCTIRLRATGSGNSAGFAEPADGACTETITGWVVIAAGGAN